MSESREAGIQWRRATAVGAVLVVGVIAATVVVARARRTDDVRADVAAAREFQRFPLYWVGERFEKWELRYVELPDHGSFGFANLIYGDCEVEDPDGLFGPEGGSCTPPLSIQISPLCSHLDVVTRSPIWKRRTIRGAPVGSSDSAPVLFARGAQIKVYRGQGSDPGLALRALRALRSLNGVPPVVAQSGPIPPPDRRILGGSRPCSDSRPGHVVIDENRGTYRGVGIGASPEAVRQALEHAPFADPNQPLSPTAAAFLRNVGAPHPLMPRCGRTGMQLLRYPKVSFVFCDRRVSALIVIDGQARTQAGLRIGDRLEAAQALYPGLRCGEARSGDIVRYPFCVGRLQPRRSLWFGQDPIASIVVSTTRFGVRGER